VERWVKPEEFVELREEALAMGFAGVMSGPLVRSSYRAGRLYAQAIEQRATALPAPGSQRNRQESAAYVRDNKKPYALGVGARRLKEG
jgi:hypothetical protein